MIAAGSNSQLRHAMAATATGSVLIGAATWPEHWSTQEGREGLAVTAYAV